MGEKRNLFSLRGVVLAKPDAARRLTGTTGAKAADNNQLRILKRRARPKAERVMQQENGAVAESQNVAEHRG